MNNTDSGIFTIKEFYNRGVIKLAPDALVYVGGALTTSVIAPVSSKDSKLTFNDGITSINVQNNIDPPGSSSASIEFMTPVYGENSNYWVEYPGIDSTQPVRYPLFVPMMEVKIYFKGRYMVKGKPRYYVAFWGFVTNVEENFSGGVYKINLNCADMLHWWAYSKINIHPSLESNIMAGAKQKLTVWASIFDKMNPYQIIHKLTEDMGQHSFVTTAWATQNSSTKEIYPAKAFQKLQSIVSSYWQQRFANMGSLLKMYGIGGKRVDKAGILQILPNTNATRKNYTSQTQRALSPRDNQRFSLDVSFIRKFMPFADFQKMGSFENAEYMTKLEIATTIKNRIEYEFFQDVNGDWVLKPPFYNLNTKGILPYTILPSDIQNSSFSQDSEGIVTTMTVFTPMDPLLKTTTYVRGVGFHMDIDLMKRYGVRSQEKTVEYIYDRHLAKTLAVSQLNQINAKTITGSVTIPGRPEMRLGYPVYMEHKDSFHYVKSINHAFDYAGSFTTTLSFETERRRMYDPKTKELLKDRVFRYTGKIPVELSKKVDVQDPEKLYITDPVEKKQETLLKGENRVFSMQQGKYKLEKRNVKDVKTGEKEISITSTTVPYTDVDGFSLIGAFPYGRNVNAINVLSNKADIPVLKNIYLTTMARPLYENESQSMDILFAPGEEGSVPNFLQTEDDKVPQVLGVEQDINEYNKTERLLTESPSGLKKNPALKVSMPEGVVENMVHMGAGTGSDVPSGLLGDIA